MAMTATAIPTPIAIFVPLENCYSVGAAFADVARASLFPAFRVATSLRTLHAILMPFSAAIVLGILSRLDPIAEELWHSLMFRKT